MLPVIGYSATCTYSPGYYLVLFVWFDALATNHTWSIPGMCIPGGQEENEWLTAISSLIGGNEADRKTPVMHLATEGPVVSSFYSKNKHTVSLSTCSDQGCMLFGNPKRQRILKKLVIPSWPSLKRIDTRVLQAEERML